MRRHLARLALTLVVVGFVAATPLSAHLSGGTHETWVPAYVNGRPTRVRVVLFDGTRLVRAISPADPARDASTASTRLVGWSACGSSELALSRSPGGYVPSDRSTRLCIFGQGQQIAIHFAVPIDRASITFDKSGKWMEP